MDYRFFHSIVKEVYTDIPNPKMPPQGHLRELRRYAGAFDSMELGLEESYCFFNLRTPGEDPVVYLGRTGRKHNAVSEGNFLQCAGWIQTGLREQPGSKGKPGSVLLEHFDEILGTRFHTEAEVDAFAEQGTVPSEEGNPVPRPIEAVKVEREAIRAVLYGTMLRWQQGTLQVHIAVPKAEMGRYNDYVLGAVKTIWSYFPAYMRASVGFSSYLSPRRERDFPKFSVIFIPYHMADVNTIRLDGSSPNAYAAMIRSTGIQQLDMVLETLATLDDPEDRKSFLRGIFEDVEKDADLKTRNFSPMAYVKWGRGLELLNAKGSVGELIPGWVKFAANKDGFPVAISRKIDEYIDKRLNPEELSKALEQELRGGRPTIESLDRIVTQYRPLCAARPTCRETLWSFLRDSLGKTGLPSEKIYLALQEKEQSWSQLTDKKSYGEVQVNSGRSAALARKDRQAKLLKETGSLAVNRERVNTAAMRAEMREQRRQFLSDTGRFVDDVSLREMDAELEQIERYYVCQALDRELQQESRLVPEGHRAIKAEQEKVAKLEELLPADRNNREQELYTRLQNRQSDLLRLLYDSRTLGADLVERIRGVDGYFEALDLAASQADNLSAEDRERLMRSVAQKRPASRAAYLDAFRKRYGKELSFRALSDKKSFFRKCVEEDLPHLYDGPQRLDMRDASAASLLRQIQSLQRESELFGAGQRLKVTMGREPLDTDMAQRVLGLHPEDVAGQDRQRVGETSMQLVRAQVFDPSQLCALLNVFAAAGCKLDVPVKSVLAGEAGELSRDEFLSFMRQALRIQQESRNMQREEALGWLSDKLDASASDGEADAAFRILASEGKKKKQGKGVLIALVAVLGLLLVGAVLGILFHWFEPKPEPDGLLPVSTEDPAIAQAYLDEQGQLSGRFDLSGKGLTNEKLNEVISYYRANEILTREQFSQDVLGDKELLITLGYRPILDLSNNPELTDLNPLGQLIGLHRLYLDGDQGIVSLEALDPLRHLELLSLRGAGVSEDQIRSFSQAHPDCVILSGIGEQRCLYLNGVCYAMGQPSLDVTGHGAALLRVMDEPGVATVLSDVRELHIGGQRLESLDALAALQKLNYLDISYAELTDARVDSLRYMPTLAMLDLAGNPDVSEETVEALRLLMPRCVLRYSPAEEKPPVETVTICGKEYPVDIEVLDLHGCWFMPEDLDELAKLSRLNALDLSNTNFADLGYLTAMPGLKRLNIRNTYVSDLTPLTNLTQLETLYADGTVLTNLGATEQRPMPALQVLTLTDVTPEADVTQLRYMPNLTILDLGNICETEETPLTETLTALWRLRILKLQHSEQLTENTRSILLQRLVIIPAMPDGTMPAPAAAPADPETADAAAQDEATIEGEIDLEKSEKQPEG